MKDVHKLFKNGFVLKITKKVKGSDCEILDSTLQTLPTDHEEESVRFHIKEWGDKNYTQPEFNPNPDKDAIAFSRTGKVLSPVTGRPLHIEDYSYTTQIIPSVGELVAVPLYEQSEFDDVAMFWISQNKGSIILDKDLNVVYENFYKPYSTFYRQEDAFKLLRDFGPSVLMFMDANQFDQRIQADVKRVFELRIKKLEDELASPEKIEEEKRLFEAAFQAVQEQYEAYQAKIAGMQPQ